MTQPPTQPNPYSSDNLTGRTLGQFEIMDEIGRGGMATVYRARQLTMNRIVAIKVLPRALMHDPSFIERFRREVDVIAHLEHPHILPIYDYGEVEGVPFIAMRYLAGGSLAQMLRRGLPPPTALIKPISQVSQALDHAHQQGIIHRDLKPGNILLDDNGNAYLTDFGIARVINSSLTGSAIIGTPAYMSPEQANGLPLDARSDIYALGVVLFEMVTGREPFEAETPVALLLKHINEPMPSPRSFRAGLGSSVERVIFKATAKHPDDRYASAGELSTDFAIAAAQPATGLMDAPVHDDQPTLIDPPGGAPRTNNPLRPVTRAKATEPPAARTAASPVRADAHTLTEVPAQAAARSNTPMLAAIFGGIVGLALLAGVGIAVLRPAPAVVTAVPTVLPTPFAGGVRTTTARYSVNVPQNWRFVDLTSNWPQTELVHEWRDAGQSSIGLVIMPMGGRSVEAVRDQVATVIGQEEGGGMTLIDEETAPDGTLRTSYRLEAASRPYGQLDLFVLLRGETAVIVKLYTADSADPSALSLAQMMLDSVRLLEG